MFFLARFITKFLYGSDAVEAFEQRPPRPRQQRRPARRKRR